MNHSTLALRVSDECLCGFYTTANGSKQVFITQKETALVLFQYYFSDKVELSMVSHRAPC